VEYATPHEVTLVKNTLDRLFINKNPRIMIADKAYDSDPLDDELERDYSCNLIAPHKENRKKLKTQDGRMLRRYKRRWKVERLFAWLQNFRRIGTRYEYHADNFLGMVLLGCSVILLRQF